MRPVLALGVHGEGFFGHSPPKAVGPQAEASGVRARSGPAERTLGAHANAPVKDADRQPILHARASVRRWRAQRRRAAH
jgi:hypothetical protein